MPDANGKFKGISVPELPWKKWPESLPAPPGLMTCKNPNCKFCAQTQPERQDS